MSNIISGEVTYAQIPAHHWYQPDWIDEDRARASRDKMVADNIIYGGSVSYRNMCRFNSGVRGISLSRSHREGADPPLPVGCSSSSAIRRCKSTSGTGG